MICRHCGLPITPFQGTWRHAAEENQTVWCEQYSQIVAAPSPEGHLVAEPERGSDG